MKTNTSKIIYPDKTFYASDYENEYQRFALVTGASSGIGEAIAEELAKRKINLVLVALPDTGLERVKEYLIHEYNIIIHTYSLDLTEPKTPQLLFDAVHKLNINLTILVNNAGFGNLELFENSDLNELIKMMTLNNQAVVSLTHLFIPLLKKSGNGYILNLGSLASIFKIPYKAVYSATKSFIYSFSAAINLELKPQNISVSCLCPGSTLTSARVRDILVRTMGRNTFFTQSPQEVAHTAIKKLFEKQFRIVPGIHNRILLGISQILPESFTDKLLVNLFKPKSLPKPIPISIHKDLKEWRFFSLANR